MNTKTAGQIVASNLRACDIISGRDEERVAKQIDAFAPLLAEKDAALEYARQCLPHESDVWKQVDSALALTVPNKTL